MYEELIRLRPDGAQLRRGRRMTYADARAWLRRSGVAVGVEPCGGGVQWLDEAERRKFVGDLAHAEGKDCNVAGDVVLYREADGDFVVVEQG